MCGIDIISIKLLLLSNCCFISWECIFSYWMFEDRGLKNECNLCFQLQWKNQRFSALKKKKPTLRNQAPRCLAHQRVGLQGVIPIAEWLRWVWLRAVLPTPSFWSDFFIASEIHYTLQYQKFKVIKITKMAQSRNVMHFKNQNHFIFILNTFYNT